MNAWALIVAGVLVGMTGTGALAAAAGRRADFACALAIACLALAVPLAGYVGGWRAAVYRNDQVAVVRIVTPKRITDRVKPALPLAVAPPPLRGESP